jgi:hypothetical protein
LDSKIAGHFTRLVESARVHFEAVEYNVDSTPKRMILRLTASYKNYKILVTELYSDQGFQYRYYVLENQFVKAGFDNAPDPRAIRLKYGKIGKEHSGELVSHLHLSNKKELVLTEVMSFDSFIAWLLINL